MSQPSRARSAASSNDVRAVHCREQPFERARRRVPWPAEHAVTVVMWAEEQHARSRRDRPLKRFNTAAALVPASERDLLTTIP